MILRTWVVALAGTVGLLKQEPQLGGTRRVGTAWLPPCPACALWTPCFLCCQSCHEGHCPFMLTECPACRGLVRLCEKARHVEQECPGRSLSCPHCRAPCCWADVTVRQRAASSVSCWGCAAGDPQWGTWLGVGSKPSHFRKLYYFRKVHTQEGSADPITLQGMSVSPHARLSPASRLLLDHSPILCFIQKFSRAPCLCRPLCVTTMSKLESNSLSLLVTRSLCVSECLCWSLIVTRTQTVLPVFC